MRVLTPTLSPTLATESATVRLFFLSALLCSVNKAVCDFAHARPIMHCIHLVGASVSEAPSCGLDGRAVTIYIYTAGTSYCACAALRAKVAGQIGNRFSPGFCTVCDFSHARPIMLSIPLVITIRSEFLNDSKQDNFIYIYNGR